MTSEELVEKVARKLAAICGNRDWRPFEAEAYHAVCISIEEAAKAAEGVEKTRDWVPGSLYDTLRRETAGAIRTLSPEHKTGEVK